MIQIILVNPSIELDIKQSADLHLASVEDYLPGYVRIAQAIHSKKDLVVLVRDKEVGNWLRSMQQKYGPERISFEERTLRSQLQKQVDLEIPEWLTDQLIESSKLLDLNIPGAANQSFEDYLLEVFLGGFLNIPGGLRRVPDFLLAYDADAWKNALTRPVVREVYLRRLNSLGKNLEKGHRWGEKQLYDWLEASPEILIRNLSALRMLAGFPEEIGKRCLGDIYKELAGLKLDLRRVPIIAGSNEKVLDEIRIYLETRLSNPNETTLDQLLDEVSGALEMEFNAIRHLFLSKKNQASPALIHRVQSVFKPLRNIPRLAQELDDLDLLVTQNRPSETHADWGEEAWIRWATEDYLPYRFWLENTGKLDNEIGELANSYADWLYDNYGSLLYHSKYMAWKAFLELKDQIKNHLAPVLVAVLDNLNAKFYPDLVQGMHAQGFFEQQMDYRFSMLPSCTQVSKKCLITGHFEPFKESAYKDVVEQTWSKRLKKKILYLPHTGALRTINEATADIYFLNYLPLDITLHQDEDHLGMSHAQSIRNYLSLLSQDIRSFAQRIGAERNLMVIILSDHGSTRIPAGTVNVIQKDFYGKFARDEHHRYLAIPDDELKKLPDTVRYDCYVFDRKIYPLDSNYIAARRLYRFLGTDGSAYIHGGLTPEETLVPVAIYQPISVAPRPLGLQLLGNCRLYLGAKVDLDFEITNLNNYPCQSVVVEVADPNVQAENAIIEELPKLKRLQVRLTGRTARSTDTSAGLLHIRVTYQFLGKPWVNEMDIPVEITDPAKPKFDLDNL